ncbi:MAG TPA: hypothetical protein VIE69_05060 [Methylophilaceae bacterium]|jgi:hypothetical protein
MKAVALGIFTGGILRTVFGMGALNSTSMNVPRVLFGIVVGVIVMLAVGGIVELLRSSGKAEDIFD